MKSEMFRKLVTRSVTLLMALCSAATAEPDDADLLRVAAANPRERDLADGLLKLGPEEMRKKYDIEPSYHSRLDAWLSRGSLTTKLAVSRSPKALLGHLEKSGISYTSSVAYETWMLCQFSHIYRDQLRLQNERDFPQAGALARSIRDALNAVNGYLHSMCSERSYARDMIWGHSEWLLHQANSGFVSADIGNDVNSTVLWATLRSELLNCRDSEGNLTRGNWDRGHDRDHEMLETCLQEIQQAMKPWNSDGRDYLLTELILLARDRHYYLNGGANRPRAASLIRTRRGPQRKDDGTGETEEKTRGQVMVTLSSGRREIWDADSNCSRPRTSWGSVAWIRNVRQEDTPATADQSLRVVCRNGSYEIKPRGGWIQEFDSYFQDGATIVSIDRKGDTWLERYDFEKKEIVESHRKSAPKPDPFPDWASPFARLWP